MMLIKSLRLHIRNEGGHLRSTARYISYSPTTIAMLICSVSICPVHPCVYRCMSMQCVYGTYSMMCKYVYSDSALVACACVVDIHSIYLLLCVVLHV